MKCLVFYLGFATLCTHELDSMLNHEWRIIPLIRSLPEQTGMTVFIAVHILIFAILVVLIASNSSKIRHYSRLGVGLFLIAHVGLHSLFSTHPAYEFSSVLSNLLIYTGAILGLIYLYSCME